MCILFPFSPALPGSSEFILCSAMRADTFKPGFRGAQEPYLDIVTPLCARLHWEQPQILLAGKKHGFGPQSFPLAQGRQLTAPRHFRGHRTASAPGRRGSHTLHHGRPRRDVQPASRWWAWCRGEAGNGPRVPTGSSQARWTLVPPETLTPLPYPHPRLHLMLKTIPLVKREADPQ